MSGDQSMPLSSPPHIAAMSGPSTNMEIIPIKAEPADRPPPAPLLPPALFTVAAASPAPDSSSGTLVSQPTDGTAPASTSAPFDCGAQPSPAAPSVVAPLNAVAAQGTELSAAPISLLIPPAPSTVFAAGDAAAASCPTLLPLSADATPTASTLSYAPSLPGGQQPNSTLFSSSSPAALAVSPPIFTAAVPAAPAVFASPPSLCHPSAASSPSVWSAFTLPSHLGRLSSSGTMEQLLVFLLNEMSDLKRSIRTMQEEREEKRRRKRDKERRRQEEEDHERRQKEERKEADTAAEADVVDSGGESKEETEAATRAGGEDGAEGETVGKAKKKKKSKTSDSKSERKKKKRKHGESEAELQQQQQPEQTEEASENREEKKKRKRLSQTADTANPTSSVAAATSSSSSSPSHDSPDVFSAVAAPSAASQILRIGFPPAASRSSVVSSTTSSPSSASLRAVDRSLLRSARVAVSVSPPPSHTVFHPAPAHRPPSPLRPITLPSSTVLFNHSPASPTMSSYTPPLPVTTSLVSVDQNGAVQRPHWAQSDAVADMEDMPSLERVDGSEETEGRVDAFQSSAESAVTRDECMIDLSEEPSSMPAANSSTTTAAVPAASSAALPDHSPGLRPASSSTSPAVSSSSSSFSSSSPPQLSLSVAPPSLLQQEVTNKKAKLAMLAAHQKAAKQKAEQEAVERRKQAEMAAALWTAEEKKKREAAWLRWHKEQGRQQLDKDRERDRQREREKGTTRPMQQQHPAKIGRAQHVHAAQQQQYRPKSKDASWTADRSATEGANGNSDRTNGTDESLPLPWFEDRRGEKDV